MPTFQYEAMNAEGKPVVDQIEADNTEQALDKIRQMNLFPTSVTERKAPKTGVAAKTKRVRKKTLVISLGGIGNKDLTTFTRQLSTLTDAGIPVVQALNILEHQMRACSLKNVVGNVADEVESGSMLSEGMAKFPKAFDELYCNMVKAGETGGVLDLVLQRLADFREKSARLKRRVIAALIYPAAVLFFAACIVTLLILFVIPNFIAMFRELNVELPTPTRILLHITDWATNYWYLIPLTPLAVFVLYKLIASTRIGRTTVDWLKFHVPLFGSIMNKSAVARFTRTFGTLIGSGVPILEALNISRDTAGNKILANAIQGVHDSVREGDPIAAPLSQSRVCDDIVVNMIDVGEETGNLDTMLLKVADTYDQEVDVAVDGLTSLMEPMMVIGLGLIIGFIVISLFLPLIKLMQALA
jgi:type IV pilus assembly protein PilC